MTELDTRTLQLALQIPDERAYAAGTPDIAEIIARGRRLRWRRRLVAAAGALCAAAIAYGAVTGISQLAESAPVPPAHPAGPTQTVPGPPPSYLVPSPTRQPNMGTPEPSPSVSPLPAQIGPSDARPSPPSTRRYRTP
jgi:hypothetical protein